MSLGSSIKTAAQAGNCMGCKKPQVNPETGQSLHPGMLVAEIDIGGLMPRLCVSCLGKLESVIQVIRREMGRGQDGFV